MKAKGLLIQKGPQPINFILWFSIWPYLSLYSEALGRNIVGLMDMRPSPVFLTSTPDSLGIMQKAERKIYRTLNFKIFNIL